MFVEFIGGPHDGDICRIDGCEKSLPVLIRVQATSTKRDHDYKFYKWSNIEVDESCTTPREERCQACGQDHSGDKERVGKYVHRSLWAAGTW